jgi:hypothetical protein
MITIVFSACLISQAAACQDRKLNFAEEAATPVQCMMAAHFELARWSRDNPQWKVWRWSCESGRRFVEI